MTTTCKQCGKEFVPPSQSTGKFCCLRCYWDSIKGTNHPSYKGGTTYKTKTGRSIKHSVRMLRYPERTKVQKQLGRAVQRGKIQKPNYCSSCGVQKERRDICGHHEDYSKPLEVIWLCRFCHNELHKTT